jgi:hypothetical protein
MILSKTIQQSASTAASASTSTSASSSSSIRPASFLPHPIPIGVVFEDEREYQYFCLFRDEIALELSGGFDPSLWTVLVLQACDNPSVKQLTIATAALNKATKATERNIWDPEKDLHHGYALRQYGRALRGMREMVAMGQDSMRLALVSALLIFCFEGMHGDIERGAVHIQSATELIVKRLLTLPRPYRSSHFNPRRPNAPSPIDDDLLLAFIRLDGPTITGISRAGNAPPHPKTKLFNFVFPPELPSIPPGFETIAEARIYLEHIKWRALPNINPSEETAFNPHAFIPSEFKNWYAAHTNISPPPTLLSELEQWHEAFIPLWSHALSPAGDMTFIAATTLRIQALSTQLISRRSFPLPPPPTCMISFPAVHEILRLSRRLVSHPKFQKKFVFDVGIMPSLTVIMFLCPDRGLRRQAIDVMKLMVPRRECMWDTRLGVEAGEAWLEEEDNKAGLDTIDPRLFEGL